MAEEIRHGSPAGYQAHVKRREIACQLCLDAQSRYLSDYRRRHRERGKCAPGLGWPLQSAAEASRYRPVRRHRRRKGVFRG